MAIFQEEGCIMRTFRLLQRDIVLGIFRRWYIAIIPVILGCAGAIDCHGWIMRLDESSYGHQSGTVWDYIMYCMQGTSPLMFQPALVFSLPVMWTIFQFGAAYMVAYYAQEDFASSGLTLFIAVRDRKKWWRSKYIWCMLSVIIYYVIYFSAVIFTAVVYGADMSFSATKRILYVHGINVAGLSMADMVFIVILLPMLITLAISLVQIFVSFVLTPVISFALVCAMYVLSAYYTIWELPGNYTMWFRCSYIAENGLDPKGGLFMAIILMVMAIVLGRIYFENKDVC